MTRRWLARADDRFVVAAAQTGRVDALDELVARYVPVVRGVAAPYFLVGADRDDLVAEGLFGLHKAIRDFRPGGGASFRNFAVLCVRRQMVTAVKTASRPKHSPLNWAASLDAPPDLPGGDDSGAVLHEVVAAPAPSPQAAMEFAEAAALIDAVVLGEFTDLERCAYAGWTAGYSYREIADLAAELGCAGTAGRPEKFVDNALGRAKHKLRLRLRDVAA